MNCVLLVVGTLRISERSTIMHSSGKGERSLGGELNVTCSEGGGLKVRSILETLSEVLERDKNFTES